jgi:1-acyl-sn-glycerol-3-phosphate acyltransferase
MNGFAVAGGADAGFSSIDGRDRPGSMPPAATTTRANPIWLASVRAAAVLFFSLCALLQIALILPFVRPQRSLLRQAAWLHRWCRFACRVLGVHVTIRGSIPRCGLLVCNHLSYLDVIVLSSMRPCVFVAKRDVAGWPLFGWLARCAGTIFVDRNSRITTAGAVESMRETIANGALVVLFPEGTSSDGATVLPFKPALLESALQLGCEINAASIDYSLQAGSVADEVCYWREMTLVPHLLNLFTKPAIESKLVFAPFTASGRNRKEVARALRKQIMAMRL